VAVGQDHDVLRLDVAVGEPGSVGGVERAGNIHGDRDGLGLAQAGEHRLSQRLTLDEFHHQVRPAVDQSHLVDRHHARVVDAGQQRRLAAERRQRGRFGEDRCPQYLQRVVDAVPAGPVDDRLRPVPELLVDGEAGNRLISAVDIGRAERRGRHAKRGGCGRSSQVLA
jgi:hypothetical protein